MGFVSARILTPDRDGIGGYVNVTGPDGEPIAIRITGEIVDKDIPQPLRTTIEITGAELAALPQSKPGLEDTPDDPRFQAIYLTIIRALPAIHAAWRVRELSGREPVTPQAEPKPAAVLNTLPIITSDILTAVTGYGG